jgi:hypothetical protein
MAKNEKNVRRGALVAACTLLLIFFNHPSRREIIFLCIPIIALLIYGFSGWATKNGLAIAERIGRWAVLVVACSVSVCLYAWHFWPDQMRAHMHIDGISSSPMIVGQELHMIVVFRNDGAAPASVKSVYSWFQWTSYPSSDQATRSDMEDEAFSIASSHEAEVLASKHQMEQEIPSGAMRSMDMRTNPLTQEEINFITERARALYLIGNIRYSDGDIQRTTTFCAFLQGPNNPPQMASCMKHNEEP